jgi:hypothetical protein
MWLIQSLQQPQVGLLYTSKWIERTSAPVFGAFADAFDIGATRASTATKGKKLSLIIVDEFGGEIAIMCPS